MRLFLVNAVAASLLLAAAPRARAATEFMPLSDVRPGMVGVGRTVFEGSRIDEFKVTVIGVLDNVAPGQSIVLARLEGGPLANTGVIAGMSGSPVFIDGKLLGAVAYGFPFSKETIAGIQPIGSMIDATRSTTPRAASARMAPAFGASGPQMPLDQAALVSALRRPMQAVAVDSAALRGLSPGALSGASLNPLSVPLVFSGFDPATFDWAKGVFGGLGFSPVMGGSAGGGQALHDLPDLEPGSPIGISLVEGDLDLSATGTVTWVDKDRVYAFGHPFYNLGPTQFPMKKAYVYSVFPSLYQSWKISSAGELVGTMDQDRMTAIAGTLGPKPRMIPVVIRLKTSRGDARTFNLRMVEDELFTPVLAFMSLASVLQGTERAFGTASFDVDATIGLTSGRSVRVRDLFTAEQPATQAAALVAAPIAYILGNGFEKVGIDGLTIDVTSQEENQSATVQRAWIERTGPVRPGSTVPLKIVLRSYRGDDRTETIPVAIPVTARPGAYSLLVSDAATATATEQRDMRQAFVPRDLAQLLRAINSLRHSNHVYAKLLRTEDGAVVKGEVMQSLPPSVLSVLGGSDQGTTVTPLRTASVWEYDLPVDVAVTGSRVLTITVEN
jgi:hypothetical protein